MLKLYPGVIKIVTYNRLWETMKRKHVTQYRLIKQYGFSAGQIGRLKKNMYVSTHTIEVLCSILNCQVEEVMEIIPDSALSESIIITASVVSDTRT